MSRGRVVIFGWADSTHIQRWAIGLTERGFEISVISVGGKPIAGIETTIFPRSDKGAYLKHALAVRRAVHEAHPDLLHCHYASGFGLWTQIAKVRPTLVSVWGSDVIDVSGLEKWMVCRALRRASWVSATGEFLKRAALDLCPEILGRLSVIPFGVQLPEKVAPLPQGPVRICFLKEHRAIYAPDNLIEAFASARRKIPDLRLTLAGDGPMTQLLKDRLAQLGLLDAVDFPGYIDRSTIEQFLSDHHILAMPSRMESFGVAALEAASCGRPVVATDVGGIPEVVVDGKSGLLVKLGNVPALAEAIVMLATDRDKMSRMGVEGRRLVKQKYLWQQSLDQMCELYDKLIINGKSTTVL